MYNHKATLCGITASTVNTYGDTVETVSTSKVVFCRVTSADDKEKSLAATRGVSADLVIILPDKSIYNDELYVDYMGERYEVADRKFTDTSKEIRLVVGKWETH